MSTDPGGTHTFETDIRLADRHPEWELSHQMTAVPSIHEEICIQVIDNKRQEVAGETSIPLRTFLDQKDHDEWHVLPPTLRQQLVEKGPRKRHARIHLKVKFTHTKVKNQMHLHTLDFLCGMLIDVDCCVGYACIC